MKELPTLHLRFRSEAEDDIEFGRKFADAGTFERIEWDNDGVANFFVADATEDTIAFIAGLAFDVALGGEFFTAFGFNSEMDVGSAARIRDGLDRAKEVFAGRTGEKAAEALEMGVSFVLVIGAAVEVSAIFIDLPDFDEGVADGLAVLVEDAAAEPGDLADSRRGGIVDDDEVVIGIEREFIGVERSFGLAGGFYQFLGEQAGNSKEGGAEGERVEETATAKRTQGGKRRGIFHAAKMLQRRKTYEEKRGH